jgi:hypothetical protein
VPGACRWGCDYVLLLLLLMLMLMLLMLPFRDVGDGA